MREDTLGQPRRRHRRRRRHTGSPWNRMLAVLAAAALLITSVNVTGLEAVFAEEKSGYGIAVTYSDDKSQATLTGNTESLKQGVNLVSLTDASGSEYDPAQFSYPVTENGEYTFTLDYQVQEASQTRDIKEELKVTVDGIQKAEVEEAQAEAPQTEAPQTESAPQTQAEAPQATADTGADTTAAAEQERPATVALSVLQQSLAETRSISTNTAQIEIKQYAAESVTVNLEENNQKYYFEGGSLIEGDTDAIPDYTGKQARQFEKAAFVYTSVPDNMVELTGLYPLYNDDTKKYDWYYTTKTTDESSGSEGSGSVEDTKVGFLLPDGVEVRFYYALTESAAYTLTVDAAADFKVEIAGVDSDPSGNSYQVKAGARVVVTATLDNGWWWAIARLASSEGSYWADCSLERKGRPPEGNDVPSWKADVLSTDTSRYRFVFTMPSGATSLEMIGKSYVDDEDGVIWFGIGSMENNEFQSTEIGATRFYTVSKTSNANTTDTPAKLSYNRSGLPADNGGFGTYQTGAKPYMVKEGYFNSSDRYATHYDNVEYRGNTDGTANASISGADVSDKAVNAIYDRGTSSKVGVAVGELVPGGTANLRLEASRGGWGDNYTTWVYAPMTVDLDVYQNGGEYSSANFSRYTFRLPTSTNQRVSEDIPGGGHITITCAYANVAEASARDAWGRAITGFGSGGGYSPNNWFAYDIEVSGILTDWKIIYNSVSTAQTTVYTNITGGVTEGSGNYQGYLTASTMSSGLSGSWVRYRKSDTSSGAYYPLRSGEDFWKGLNELTGGNGGTTAGISFGLSVREGYSRPSFTSSPANLATVQYNGYVTEGGYNPKRYKYYVNFSLGNVKNTIDGPSVVLNIDSQPVKYAVQYYQGGAAYKIPQVGGKDVSLAYDEVENYIIQPELPNQTMNLKGYQLQVCESNGNSVQTINYNSIYTGSTQTLWMPGNMLDVRKIYQYMRDQSLLGAGVTNYTIRLIPQVAGTGDSVWMVGGIGFTAYQQTGWFELEKNENYDNFTATAFVDEDTYYKDGYSDSTVVFGNYPDVLTTTKGTYLLDEDRSTLSGEIGSVQDIVGKFYYVNATRVSIAIPDEIKGAAEFSTAAGQIEAWNGTYGNTWYTGTNGGPNQTVNLSSITLPEEITIGGQKYNRVGWRIAKSASGDLDSADNLYKYEFSGSLDLYALGTTEGDTADAGREAWNAVFGSGSGNSRTKGSAMLTLVPYYEAATRPITLQADGVTTTGAIGSRTLYVNADGSHNHTLTSTFYMQGEALTENSTAHYAIYAYGETATGTRVWGRTEHGTINLYNGTIEERYKDRANQDYYYGYTRNGQASVTLEKNSPSGYSKYTLTISGIPDHPGGTGKQYRVYMWNEGNGLDETFSPLNSYDSTASETEATQKLDTAFGNTNGTTGGAARDSYALKMIYPFTPVRVTDPDTPGAYNSAYTVGQHGVTIQTGGDPDGTATLQATYYYTGASWNDYVEEQMSIALYRDGKDADGNKEVTDQFLLTTIKLPALTQGAEQEISLGATGSTHMEHSVWITLNNAPDQQGGSFTVKLKLLNGDGNTNRLRYTYEDATSLSKRVWRVYAWNLANANGNMDNINAAPSTAQGDLDPLPAAVQNSGAQVAQVNNLLHIRPKAVSSTDVSQMHITESDPARAKEGTNFLIEATFQLDPYYPKELQLGESTTLGDDTDKADGLMHMAIMKLNPSGQGNQNWQTWMFDNTVTNSGKTSGGSSNKVEKVSVSVDDTSKIATITYRLMDVDGSISRQWEDGAQYEILAWNNTNSDALNKTLTDDLLNQEFAHGGTTTEGTSYATVPSVIHNVSMVAPEMEAMPDGQNTAVFTTHTGGDPKNGEGNGVDVTAKFRYKSEDGVTWETMRETVRFALYRYVVGGTDNGYTKWAEISYSNNGWVLTPVVGVAGNKLSRSVDVTASAVETGEGYQVVSITARILNKDQSGPSIRYAWEDSDSSKQTQYLLYAWSEGNEYQKAGTGNGNEANDLVYEEITTQARVEPETDAKFSAKLNVLPDKVRSTQTGGGSGGTDLGDGIYHWSVPESDTPDADGSISLSATFETDQYWYPSAVGVKETDKTEQTTLRAALFIRFASATTDDGIGTAWEKWKLIANQDTVKEDGALSDKGLQIVTANGPTTTVSWTLNATYVGGETFQYCVALWNDTNTGASVSAEQFTPEDPSTEGTYNKIPSVTQEIRPKWQNPSYYVYVPKTIILTEDGASDNLKNSADGETYVGNSGTIGYVAEVDWDNNNGEFPETFPKVTICTARQLHISNSGHTKTITVDVYQSNGTALEPDEHGKPDHGTIGTLQDGTTESLTYQLNAKLPDGIKKDEVFSGIMTYHFNSENHDTTEAGGTGQ